MERSTSLEPQDGDPQPTRRRRRRAQQMQQDQQPQPQPQQPAQQGALGSVNQSGVTNPASQAGPPLGNAPDQMAGQPSGGGEKKEALKLRLDLNLDVDVQIKARVHGDVTLSLL